MNRFDKTGVFHDKQTASKLVSKLATLVKSGSGTMAVMHVCGTHEHVIAESGIRSMLPGGVNVISGPGCPVCVCHTTDIFKALVLSEEGHLVATFGDMLRVPSDKGSLQDARGRGLAIHVVYGIDDAVQLAVSNPDKQVIFFAVGFETFAPVVATAMLSTLPENISFLCSLKTITPVMELLLSLGNLKVDGFITPGHVSAIIGTEPYDLFSRAYRMPIVTAGFQPNDILLALAMIAKQVKDKAPRNENEYSGVVRREGNTKALRCMDDVFEKTTTYWRGIGAIPDGGYRVRDKYGHLDANQRFSLDEKVKNDAKANKGIPPGCSCHLVITGQMRPESCPLFKNGKCNPQVPVGPCMVSDEGTCRIAALYREDQE